MTAPPLTSSAVAVSVTVATILVLLDTRAASMMGSSSTPCCSSIINVAAAFSSSPSVLPTIHLGPRISPPPPFPPIISTSRGRRRRSCNALMLKRGGRRRDGYLSKGVDAWPKWQPGVARGPELGFFGGFGMVMTTCRASSSSSSSSGDDGDGPSKVATAGATDEKKSKGSSSRPSGVYSRPSAAIERGSGFYVPGLEGSRVRALFGAVVLALCRANHVLSSDVVMAGGGGNDSMAISEGLAYGFGGLLLLQALVELGKEAGLSSSPGPSGIAGGVTKDDDSSSPSSSSPESGEGGSSATTGSKSLDRIVSPSLAESSASTEAVQWAAASYVALTPATHFLLVQDDIDDDDDGGQVLFALGDLGGDLFASGAEGVGAAVASAVRTVGESRGGRVSVPSTHPAAVGMLPADCRRCVLLQRVDDGEGGEKGGRRARRCIVVGSDQLLPAFTKGDLSFLGCLARYVELTVTSGAA